MPIYTMQRTFSAPRLLEVGVFAFIFRKWLLTNAKGTSSSELDWLVSFQPRTKEDFAQFSTKVIEFIIKRHQDKPLYASFVEQHVKELAAPLKDVEVRKAASGLTTLANEKQKEQRTGKKKPKVAAKPALGKAGSK